MHRKTFQFQPADVDARGVRTYDIAITSMTHAYTARVTEMTSAGAVPVTISTRAGSRISMSPESFHRMRRHHRGELVGIVQAALRTGQVERIDQQPHVPSIAAFDRYIRVDPIQVKNMHPSYTGAVEDDLSDWGGACRVFPDAVEGQ